MYTTDKGGLIWYIEELLKPEENIVIISDDDIIHLEVNGRSFFLYIKSLTYAGNPYPLYTTRAQLPRREEFNSIKESDSVFLFLGYDDENEVFACWEPNKTKARLNEKQYVSFFSRLYLQKIAKKEGIVCASLQNGLKYVLFDIDNLPKFLLDINDFFADLSVTTEAPEVTEKHAEILKDAEEDDSVKSFLDKLYEKEQGESKLFLVSSCIKEFGERYNEMSLQDWHKLISGYIEQKNDYTFTLEEQITDLSEDEESKDIWGKDDNYILSDNLLEEILSFESNENLRNYLLKALSYPDISSEETKELLENFYDGDKKAFDLLVYSNLKIVVNIACQFKNCGASLEDLIQVGSLGLINAIKFFRNKKGTNFNSYIRFGIYAFILDSSLDLPYLLTFPAKIISEHIKYHRLYDEFELQNDYPPSIDDIDLGEEVGIKRKKFISQLPSDLRDLTYFVDDYESFEDNSNMPDEELMKESTQIYVQGLLSFLSKREEQIIQAYYGINGITPESLEEIGNKHGLTRERVRQIHEKAIRKLKNLLGVNRKKEEELSSKEKEKQIKLTDNMIEKCGFSHLSKKNESLSIQNITHGAWTSLYNDYLKMRAQTVRVQIPQKPVQEHIQVKKKKELYTLNTLLHDLVKQRIITKNEFRQCKHKGLRTIGDVKRIIVKYNITRTSTRFTQYTINLWFKIVGLLDSNSQKDSVSEKTDVILPNSQYGNLEDTYVKYFLKINAIRQAKINGNVNIAKPVLLLAIIDGVTEGDVKNNHIILNEYLEKRYNSLMGYFSKQTKTTPINMPFWHLETDGFWHLNIQGEKPKDTTPTTNWLKENVLYASLDKELWILLQNQEWRTKLRNFIITHKLSQ